MEIGMAAIGCVLMFKLDLEKSLQSKTMIIMGIWWRAPDHDMIDCSKHEGWDWCYTPVHLVESVENYALCMRRCLLCSSNMNVTHCALAFTHVQIILTPVPSNELWAIASYRLFHSHGQVVSFTDSMMWTGVHVRFHLIRCQLRCSLSPGLYHYKVSWNIAFYNVMNTWNML